MIELRGIASRPANRNLVVVKSFRDIPDVIDIMIAAHYNGRYTYIQLYVVLINFRPISHHVYYTFNQQFMMSVEKRDHVTTELPAWMKLVSTLVNAERDTPDKIASDVSIIDITLEFLFALLV